VSLLFAHGLCAEDVVDDVERRLGEPRPGIRFVLGEALHEAGAAKQAERQLRLALDRESHSSAARVALAEALLSQRRYADTATEAAAVADDDELAPAARRTELFGRILGGELELARDVVRRAAACRIPDEELRAFAGWAEVAGGSVGPSLPVSSVPPLMVVLDVLLRIQDFKAFEVLVALLHRSELAPREQRERLAGLYLKRGFLQSAAKEWMAVCEAAPDDRALVGLARVAAEHGLPEDAATFATEAMALNPDNAFARKLVGVGGAS
jgi:tetratricopeptide (TPR) repeat protein